MPEDLGTGRRSSSLLLLSSSFRSGGGTRLQLRRQAEVTGTRSPAAWRWQPAELGGRAQSFPTARLS
ncbi:unnamed protein product, partial [Pleuronectes platessa]